MNSVRLKLSLMMFLQYFVWGSWAVSAGGYMGTTLRFAGDQVTSIYATTAIAEARAHESMLFDVREDPAQEKTLDNPKIEKMMIDHLVRLMKENDAPPDQFIRLGLDG